MNAAQESITSGKKRIDRLRGIFDTGIPAGMRDALRSLLAARDYDDVTLIKSYLNSALESWRDAIQEAISKRLEWASASRRELDGVFAEFEGYPSENFDSIGNELRSTFDKILDVFAQLSEAAAFISQHGYVVANAAELDREIKTLRDLRDEIVKSWPWSSRPFPSVDRAMLAESKSAYQRGEGIDVRELVKEIVNGKPETP